MGDMWWCCSCDVLDVYADFRILDFDFALASTHIRTSGGSSSPLRARHLRVRYRSNTFCSGLNMFLALFYQRLTLRTWAQEEFDFQSISQIDSQTTILHTLLCTPLSRQMPGPKTYCVKFAFFIIQGLDFVRSIAQMCLADIPRNISLGLQQLNLNCNLNPHNLPSINPTPNTFPTRPHKDNS